MAEALLQRQLRDADNAEEWQIISAGTWTSAGLPATQLAQQIIARRGLDLSAHRSRLVDAELLRSATVILVMTRNQLEAIQSEFPETIGKTYLLSQLINQDYDIEDPYGGTEADYEMCAEEIQHILVNGIARLGELTDEAIAAAT